MFFMKRFNSYINCGLLFNSIFLVGNGFNILPEFIKGICAGLGLTLIFMGMYHEKYDIANLKDKKKNILKRLLLK